MTTTSEGSTAVDEPEITDAQRVRFTRDEIPRLAGMIGFIALLYVLGWGLFAHYNSIPQLHNLSGSDGKLIYAGAGTLAFTFGLRHAFDADHISAIDDTTRYLLQKGKRPLGVGFFFSLGHSTVVFAFVTAIAFIASKATAFQESFQGTGGIIGTVVSGGFLYLIAALNLAVLGGIIKMWRQAKRGEYSPEDLDQLLANRGFMNRLFKGRYNKFINNSWQMYLVGLLFGLGFDTASQVGLLAVAGSAAIAGGLPPLAIIALPILFAAGMSTMDTLDGVFMSKAYGWAFVTRSARSTTTSPPPACRSSWPSSSAPSNSSGCSATRPGSPANPGTSSAPSTSTSPGGSSSVPSSSSGSAPSSTTKPPRSTKNTLAQ